MTAESVNMDAKEFDSYVNGTAVPPGSWKASLLMCESLQGMSQDLKLLADLKERYNKAMSETTKLQEGMNQFQTDIANEVERVLEKTSYTIKGPKKPVALDDESMEAPAESSLPLPLTPQNSSTGAISNHVDNLMSLTDYKGFSIQNSQIPSISCSNVVNLEKESSSND